MSNIQDEVRARRAELRKAKLQEEQVLKERYRALSGQRRAADAAFQTIRKHYKAQAAEKIRQLRAQLDKDVAAVESAAVVQIDDMGEKHVAKISRVAREMGVIKRDLASLNVRYTEKINNARGDIEYERAEYERRNRRMSPEEFKNLLDELDPPDKPRH